MKKIDKILDSSSLSIEGIIKINLDSDKTKWDTKEWIKYLESKGGSVQGILDNQLFTDKVSEEDKSYEFFLASRFPKKNKRNMSSVLSNQDILDLKFVGFDIRIFWLVDFLLTLRGSYSNFPWRIIFPISQGSYFDFNTEYKSLVVKKNHNEKIGPQVLIILEKK